MTDRLAIDGGTPALAAVLAPGPALSPAGELRILDLLRSGRLNRFWGGVEVRRLERTLSDYFGRGHAVALNSGTGALHVAYAALDLPPGSEVIIPGNAYVSAASAAIQAGLVPVLADIDAASWVMTASQAAVQLSERTRAITAVHMYGQPTPMTDLVSLCEDHGLALVEDCAAAHGARDQGQLLGSFGRIACFSLCCDKLVTAGEGGASLTDDPVMAERMRSLAHKGKGPNWFDYRELGYSYALSEVAALIASDSLERLEGEPERRSRIVAHMRERLGDTVQMSVVRNGDVHAYFRLNLQVERDVVETAGGIERLTDAVNAENVAATPAHPSLTAIEWLRGHLGRLTGPTPVADELMPRQLSLPMGAIRHEADASAVAGAIRKVVTAMRARI